LCVALPFFVPFFDGLFRSLVFFTDLVNLPLFTSTEFVLIFNKEDLFKEKVKHLDLSLYFPDFPEGVGSTDPSLALNWIKEAYLSRVKKPRKIKSFVSNATNTSKSATPNIKRQPCFYQSDSIISRSHLFFVSYYFTNLWSSFGPLFLWSFYLSSAENFQVIWENVRKTFTQRDLRQHLMISPDDIELNNSSFGDSRL
jgi:hypothetical protein